MKKCPFCAEEIQDEAVVCRHCQRDLNAPPPLQPGQVRFQPAEKKKGGGLFLLLLLGGVIIFGVAADLIQQEINKPKPLTPEQLAAQAEQNRKDEERRKAELEKFYKTPAGRLCKKHPGWGRTDCERVLKKQVWVGMTLEMAIHERGNPNVANPSNYGNGVRWQWCWYDWTPSCLYGKDDQVINSYN